MSVDVVTGAFSYTGRAIAEELLSRGRAVRSLSRRTPSAEDPLAGRVAVAPLAFDRSLDASLAGATTLYNTYWIRFERPGSTFAEAVRNTERLFAAAARAGVERIVHVSVANAAEGSSPYFRGKALTEVGLRSSGVPYAIVRPTLVFGTGDILLNNIAWALRRLPLFLVPGDGHYPVQPVSLADVARIAVGAATDLGDPEVDAAGPATYSYRELVELLRDAVAPRTRILSAPQPVALAVARLAGVALRDVVVTADELAELAGGRLRSDAPPLGIDSIEAWLASVAGTLGARYASELERNFAGG